jgi:hypothetical protein
MRTPAACHHRHVCFPRRFWVAIWAWHLLGADHWQGALAAAIFIVVAFIPTPCEQGATPCPCCKKWPCSHCGRHVAQYPIGTLAVHLPGKPAAGR